MNSLPVQYQAFDDRPSRPMASASVATGILALTTITITSITTGVRVAVRV